MTEPDVLYPTVETNETQDLSQYLVDQVRQQAIPCDVAMVFNRLPELQLQKEAVSRFQANQTPAAWRIVKELQNPPSFSSPRINSKIGMGTLGIVVAGWLVWVAFPPKRALPSRLHTLETVPRAPAPHVEIGRPPLTAAISASSRKLKITVQKHTHPKHEISHASKGESWAVLVPAHLKFRPLSQKETLLTWDNLGKGYTYTVYIAEDAAMHDVHKEHDRILVNSYLLHALDVHRPNCWIAVTSTNPKGQESDFSGNDKSEILRVWVFCPFL